MMPGGAWWCWEAAKSLWGKRSSTAPLGSRVTEGQRVCLFAPYAPHGLKPPILSGMWSWWNEILCICRFTQNLAESRAWTSQSYSHWEKRAREAKYREMHQFTKNESAEWKSSALSKDGRRKCAEIQSHPGSHRLPSPGHTCFFLCAPHWRRGSK